MRGFGGRKRKENDIISKNSIDNKNKEKRKKQIKLSKLKIKQRGKKSFLITKIPRKDSMGSVKKTEEISPNFEYLEEMSSRNNRDD